MDDKLFYEYVLSLLFEAGHVITPFPIYRNHTSNEALYTNIYEFGGINTWPYETEP